MNRSPWCFPGFLRLTICLFVVQVAPFYSTVQECDATADAQKNQGPVHKYSLTILLQVLQHLQQMFKMREQT